MSSTDAETHAQDGDHVTRNETNDTKDQRETKTVSFDKDVQVKRFGKPRESRSSSTEYKPPIRKEPFTHLSKEELIKEANKVRAQTESVTCTADHPPEKFYSLPHRRKFRPEEKVVRRNSEEDTEQKKPLGRSTSDVNPKKRRERTSLSTLFRRAQKSKSPETVKVSTKPVVVVKRSKSDVSDLKSKPSLNIQPKPIRKRSGSETEEFLKSLRNKKSQLSPIIENSPRDDYFRKTPPLEAFQKKKLQEAAITEDKSPERKVNPIEKPPRYKSPDKEPKAPVRTKRGKSEEKLEPTISETPKRKVDVKKTLLVDEIDSVRGKDINPVEVKDRIKESIRKIEENIYGTKDMIHSSQQPPDKPPLTRGHTVDHIVRILKRDQFSPPPKSHLVYQNSTNVNQPFSYTKPSVSPDPNLFTRTTSPDRIPSPVNKMDKGVVYAHVVRDNVENGTSNFKKQTVHKTYSPSRDRFNGNHSDEDEGLGFDDRQKTSPTSKYEYDYKRRNEENFKSSDGIKITDSPIRPRFREYKLTSFDDFEPTYANEHAKESRDFVDSAVRGRGDGMDTIRKQFEDKVDLNFNELSHRRHLLESRLNARKLAERPRAEPVSRFLEKDPIYEAEKRMKATEKYVNETARYYRHTTERDGFAESKISEDFNKYDSDNNNIKYNTESRTFNKIPKGELDRREFIDTLPSDRFKDELLSIPPEPEYEPPSLELQKPVLSSNEYTEKKYKVKSKHITSSHDVIQTNKYKKDDFGKRKGHYASNPEINQEREDDYANTRETYHNSLKREKNRDKYRNEMRRHGSTDSYGYRDDRSPRRFEIDNRLVDSGIENDFRKDSGELHRYRRPESDDDARDTSLFLANERRHTEDNYPSEQVYANGEYITRFEKPGSRERSADDGALFDRARYDKSPSREEKVSAKPPKAKKLSGLEKVKQLFSRDSSKKSKKEKVTEKPRTRVLKSPEHLGDYTSYREPENDPYRDQKAAEETRYRDPEASDDERRYRGSKDHLDRYRSSDPRDSDPEKYRYEDRYKEDRYNQDKYRVKERSLRTEKKREERRWYESSDRDSDQQARPSDVESDLRPSRNTRSKTADPLDSPALAERYRERRRLATPSPTPSPPRRATPASPPQTSSGNWFKSLDRLTRKRSKNTKVEKDTGALTEDESPKSWTKPAKPLNSPAKNLRFFGDTDVESDHKHSTLTKTRSNPSNSVLRKTVSNSSQEEPRKSGSMNSLHREVRKTVSGSSQDEDRRKSGSMNSLHGDRKYYRRNLHNISEIHSASETESTLGRKIHLKPPIPHERRSRSHSSSKNVREDGRRGEEGRRGEDLRRGEDGRRGERGSSSELRGSRQEIRDQKYRRRTPGNNSGESSTEGESSHQSQRSVVFLHATTVGDIPDPGALARNRSRDDVSSVNSSNLQIRTTQKSFSIFAPWTPRHYSDQHDVHYAQRPRKPRVNESKSSSIRNLNDRPGTLQKKKSYSQTTLSRKPQNSRLTSSSTTLNRDKRRDDSVISGTISRNKKTQSKEVLNKDNDRVSRSISMPKDKKAGWFNLTNKNKKQEINTRVR